MGQAQLEVSENAPTVGRVVLEDGNPAGKMPCFLEAPDGSQAGLGHRVLVRREQFLQVQVPVRQTVLPLTKTAREEEKIRKFIANLVISSRMSFVSGESDSALAAPPTDPVVMTATTGETVSARAST